MVCLGVAWKRRRTVPISASSLRLTTQTHGDRWFNGRTMDVCSVFSTVGLNTSQARVQERDRNPRVHLADASNRRSQGGNVRRQAPSRGTSVTVRGQARHPFGFGQVPGNWREGAAGTGETSRFQSSSGSRFRQSSGSSSSSSSSSYPQYPFPQQPPYSAPHDSVLDRSNEPPFRGTGYSTGGGFAAVGYGGGGSSTGSFGGGSYNGGGPATDDRSRYYPSYGQPYQAVPAQPAQPLASDGFDHRYMHSLYNEDSRDAAVPVSSNTGSLFQPAVQSPQYEQFPPFGRPQAQSSFVQSPPRNPLISNNAESPNVNAGSVYRPQQRGMMHIHIVYTCERISLYMPH